MNMAVRPRANAMRSGGGRNDELKVHLLLVRGYAQAYRNPIPCVAELVPPKCNSALLAASPTAQRAVCRQGLNSLFKHLNKAKKKKKKIRMVW